MHEIEVSAEFAAAHAITLGGERESLHGHNWRVLARLEGPRLDEDGLLCDFHLAEDCLKTIVAPFHNQDLSQVTPFDTLNPTAEQVAEHIATRLHTLLEGKTPPDVRVASVSVTEAPGCMATYRPPRSGSAS